MGGGNGFQVATTADVRLIFPPFELVVEICLRASGASGRTAKCWLGGVHQLPIGDQVVIVRVSAELHKALYPADLWGGWQHTGVCKRYDVDAKASGYVDEFCCQYFAAIRGFCMCGACT